MKGGLFRPGKVARAWS